MSWLGRIFKNSTPASQANTWSKQRPQPPKGDRAQASPSPYPVGTKQSDAPPLPEQIELELRHFHNRIPPELLNPSEPDLSRVLKFKASDIRDLIAKGKITIPVSILVAQMPDLFAVAISPENDVEVFFPWRQVASLIAISDSQHCLNSQKSPVFEPIFANRVIGHVSPAAANFVPPPHLREPGAGGPPSKHEQRQATLNARKQAWFGGPPEGTQPESVETSPLKASADKQLQAEIHNLRTELLKTRKERDEALAALGLPSPPEDAVG